MTTATTATGTKPGEGPLTRRVRAFTNAQGTAMAKGIKEPSDWDPVAEFVDTENFKRVGAYLEELDWETYKQFLTGWAKGGTRFEFTEFFVTECGNTVFQEIEERHHHDGQFIKKNVIAVYRFNDAGKIAHLDIYEQADDSGDWIRQSAKAAMG
jgi:hypothetical protein